MKTNPKVPRSKRSTLFPLANRNIASALAVLAVYFLTHGPPKAVAQAPSSIAGTTFSGLVTAATTPPSAPPGSRWLLLPDSSGNGYQIRGIWHVANDSGTYSYSASGATGTANFADNTLGPLTGIFNFVTVATGTLHMTNPPNYMESDFELFSGAAPDSVAGRAYYLQVEDGASPFASTGSMLLKIAAGAGSYAIVGDGVNTANSSGTYSYTKVNAATGELALNDSVMGNGTAYLSFSNSIAGQFAVKGFQIGRFVELQTAVQIASPVSGPDYTNTTGAIDLAGTATDNLGISQVLWTNNLGGSGTAAGTTSWTATGIALQPGLNVITVTALDTVRNTAQATLAVTYAPSLSITLKGSNIVLSWPTNFVGFRLQKTVQLEPGTWSTVNLVPPPVVLNGYYAVTIPITSDPQREFYRLSSH